MYNKQVCQAPQQMAKKKKQKKTRLDNLALNAKFKWQPLKVAALIIIWNEIVNYFKDALSNSFNYSWFNVVFSLSKLLR